MKNLLKVAGISLAFSVLLTGCSKPAEELAPTPTPSPAISTPTATPTPTAKPVESSKPKASTPADFTFTPDKGATAEENAETKKLVENHFAKPLDINVKEAIQDYGTPEIEKMIVDGADVEKGVQFGLATYRDLISTQNFYQKRDATKDFDLLNINSLDGALVETLEKSIKTDGSMTHIYASDAQGKFTYKDKAGKHSYTLTQMPASTFNTPEVSVNKKGDIQIDGWRSLVQPVKGGTLNMTMGYSISVVQTADDEFKVASFGWSVDSDGGDLNYVAN